MTKCIIFDLDGTLYQDTIFSEILRKCAIELIAREQNITIDSAEVIFDDMRVQLSNKYGFTVSISYVVQQAEIHWESWEACRQQSYWPFKVLKPDLRLHLFLQALSSRMELILLTNNSHEMAMQILEAMGIVDFFSEVITFNTFLKLKPDVSILHKVLQSRNYKSNEYLCVGDRYEIDLKPAEELGMKIFHVKGIEDLLYVLDIVYGKWMAFVLRRIISFRITILKMKQKLWR